MDADRNIIPITEDDQGEGFVDEAIPGIDSCLSCGARLNRFSRRAGKGNCEPCMEKDWNISVNKKTREKKSEEIKSRRETK